MIWPGSRLLLSVEGSDASGQIAVGMRKVYAAFPRPAAVVLGELPASINHFFFAVFFFAAGLESSASSLSAALADFAALLDGLVPPVLSFFLASTTLFHS